MFLALHLSLSVIRITIQDVPESASLAAESYLRLILFLPGSLPPLRRSPCPFPGQSVCGQHQIHEHRYDVAINNEKLADALTALPDDKRDIVLLAYFLDMSDQEIADMLNMVRRTVQYRRTSSLKEMKQRLEVHEDGGQSEE